MSAYRLIVPICVVGVPLGVLAMAEPQDAASHRMVDERNLFRLVQTNLRETDTALDPKRLVQQLGDFPANVLLMGMGGIAAHFPSKVESHYVSPHLPPGRDTFGEVLEGSARAQDSRHRTLRLQQSRQADLRRPSRLVLPQGQRGTGHLQRSVRHLHQRRVLSRADAEDFGGGAGTIRRRRAVFQCSRPAGL